MGKTSIRIAILIVILCCALKLVNCDVNLNHEISFSKLIKDKERFRLDDAKDIKDVCKSVEPGKHVSLQMNSKRPVAVRSIKMDCIWTSGIDSISMNYKEKQPVLRWDEEENMPFLSIKNTGLDTDIYVNVKLVFKRKISISQIGEILVYNPNGKLLNYGISDSVKTITVYGRSYHGDYTSKTSNDWKTQKTNMFIIQMILTKTELIGHFYITLLDLGIASVKLNGNQATPILSWDGNRSSKIITINNNIVGKPQEYFQVKLFFNGFVNTWPIHELLIYDPEGKPLNVETNTTRWYSYYEEVNGWIYQNQIKGGDELRKPTNEIWIETELLSSKVGKVIIVLDDPFGIDSATVNNIQTIAVREIDTRNNLQFLNISNPNPHPDLYFYVKLMFQRNFKIWPIHNIFVFDPKGDLQENFEKNVFIKTSHEFKLRNQIKGGSTIKQSTNEIWIKINLHISDVGRVEIALYDPFVAKLRTRSGEMLPIKMTGTQVSNNTLNISLLFDNHQNFTKTTDLELLFSCSGTLENNWSVKAVDIFGQIDCENPDQDNFSVIIHRDGRTNLTDWAKYTCPQGQNAVGDTTTVCQSNGNWSGPPPRCELENGISNVHIYVIIAVGSLSVAVITALCIWKWKRLVTPSDDGNPQRTQNQTTGDEYDDAFPNDSRRHSEHLYEEVPPNILQQTAEAGYLPLLPDESQPRAEREYDYVYPNESQQIAKPVYDYVYSVVPRPPQCVGQLSQRTQNQTTGDEYDDAFPYVSGRHSEHLYEEVPPNILQQTAEAGYLPLLPHESQARTEREYDYVNPKKSPQRAEPVYDDVYSDDPRPPQSDGQLYTNVDLNPRSVRARYMT